MHKGEEGGRGVKAAEGLGGGEEEGREGGEA